MTRGKTKSARKGRHDDGDAVVRRSFDTLKRYYGVAPLPAHCRVALPPYYAAAYSRRATLTACHILGAPHEQTVLDAMRTFTATTCTREVGDAYRHVAALVSVYYDMLDQLALLRRQCDA